eukprot:TRINITY_DN697_c0_g1_i1.p1 TRINITY_DN697_c0_g1~~TRINITY_DN697_c0_g1_i1.p1  ORF type:complete len:194 (-),score=33.90 TRINITY_DN697_c0_g1_i1:720-1301(-)
MFTYDQAASLVTMLSVLQNSYPAFKQITFLQNLGSVCNYAIRPWAEGMVLFAMPRLSQSMELGSVKRWLKSEGDLVKENELIVELETDSLTQDAEKIGKFEGKLTLEIESTEEVYLAKILEHNGSKQLKVGVPIAVLCESATQVKKASEFDPPLLNVYDDETQIRTLSWQAYLKAEDQRGMGKVKKVLEEYKR